MVLIGRVLVAALMLSWSVSVNESWAQTRPEIPQISQKLDDVVHAYFGLYVIARERRDASEQLTFRNGTLSIRYQWSKRASQKGIECSGGRWLLVGRLKSALGARALFRKLPKVQKIQLHFVQVDTSVKPIGDGKYQQMRHVKTIAEFELTRDRAMKLDPDVLRNTLVGQRCARFVRTLLDRVRIGASP